MFLIGTAFVNRATNDATRRGLEAIADINSLWETQQQLGQRMAMMPFHMVATFLTGRASGVEENLLPIPSYAPKPALPRMRVDSSPLRLAFHLQGGCKAGIYQAHFLIAVLRHANIDPVFFTGTSAGAMNAGLIAYNWKKFEDLAPREKRLKTADALEKFWGDVVQLDETSLRQPGLFSGDFFAKRLVTLLFQHTQDEQTGVSDFSEIVNHPFAPTLIINAMRRADAFIAHDQEILFRNQQDGGTNLPLTLEHVIASAALDTGSFRIIDPVRINQPVIDAATGACVATSSLCYDAGVDGSNPPLLAAQGIREGTQPEEAVVVVLDPEMGQANRTGSTSLLRPAEKRVLQQMALFAHESPIPVTTHFASFSTPGMREIKMLTGSADEMLKWARDGQKAGEAYAAALHERQPRARLQQTRTYEAA